MSEIPEWYPQPDQKPAGSVRALYNGLKDGPLGALLWSGVTVALAGSLLLSVIASAREARGLIDRMERLEEELDKVRERNEAISDGRQ
jgi:hypothetical protein